MLDEIDLLIGTADEFASEAALDSHILFNYEQEPITKTIDMADLVASGTTEVNAGQLIKVEVIGI